MSSETRSIKLNGEDRSVSSTTIAELLAELELANRRVAVERNKEIVQRELYVSTPLQQGDELEIIHFVGGG